MTIKEALQVVINESNNEDAKTYARAGLELGNSHNAVVVEKGGVVATAHEKTGEIMTGKELNVQILYVLSNLAGWRGERAREIKAFLKTYQKETY